MKWCILVLACCSTALAHPPGVKYTVDSEVTGVIRKIKGEYYVEREQSESEIRELERFDGSLKAYKEGEQAWERRWKLDITKCKVDKEQLNKLVGTKVEVIGKSPLEIVEGGVPADRNRFQGRDLFHVAQRITVTEIKEVK